MSRTIRNKHLNDNAFGVKDCKYLFYIQEFIEKLVINIFYRSYCKRKLDAIVSENFETLGEI